MFRLGIIGCGRIVEEAHAPALAPLADTAVVKAIADPSVERRNAVAGLLASPPAEYDDWREMLRAEELDVAVVAVPHHLHVAAIEDAAAAGLDVISEKPLANTLEEIDRVAAAIDGAGVRLSVMHNWMHNPDARAVLDAIGAGRIGEPFLVRNESLLGVPWQSRDPAGDWRLDAARAGGGVVIDAVYHPIYVAEAEMRSPIVRVYASFAGRGRSGVEDTAVIVLEHENGGATSIQRSHAVGGGGAAAHEVHGTEGSIRFRQSDPLVLNLIMAGKPPPAPPPGAPAKPALEIFERGVGEWRPIELETGPWWAGIGIVFERTFAAWSAGDEAPAGLEGARHVLEVVTAIYESAERGRSVELVTGGART
jgi:predicted dehydrogenase